MLNFEGRSIDIAPYFKDFPLPLAPLIVIFELGLSDVFKKVSNIIALPSSSVPK